MTPEREAYLAKCGKLEKKYREWIAKTKETIKDAKENLNRVGVDVEWEKHILRSHKIYLGWYRHELNRLKGMDRVVVPKVTYVSKCNDTFMQRLERCTCGERLIGENYCPGCGRKILWEKVK